MPLSIAIISLLFTSCAFAHLVMKTPQQWTVAEGQAQAPLATDHSDYPCQHGTPGASMATYEPGSEQTLQLMGSAVHGGGSAQMVITYDTNPTSDSVFRVMTSWEGNHPVNSESVNNANYPADPSRMLDPIKFTVPSGLPKGDAVVAWVWWNKIGNREMYMKCSTITIGGSSIDQTSFEALPTMFEANDGNGCIVPEGTQGIIFKNPGPNVVGTGTTMISCDNTKAGNGFSNSSYAISSAAIVGTATNAASTSVSTSTGIGLGGGELFSNSISPSTALPSSMGPDFSTATAPAASSIAADLACVCSSSENMATITSSTVTAPHSAPTGESSSTSGFCVEGAIICDSTSIWSVCSSGEIHNMGAVEAGMQCVDGAISMVAGVSASFQKREVRFSPSHLKRHIIPARRHAPTKITSGRRMASKLLF